MELIFEEIDQHLFHLDFANVVEVWHRGLNVVHHECAELYFEEFVHVSEASSSKEEVELLVLFCLCSWVWLGNRLLEIVLEGGL